MATEKQILANRANAQLSTGPRTQAGKDIARRNSMKTGLRSLGFVLPEHVANEIAQHADWIHSTLKADNPFEHALEETLAHEMVQVVETERCLVARKICLALRAQEFWDDDQLERWAEVAETLPTKPAAIARRMRNNMHGCLIMIERWGQLEEILGRSGDWKPEQYAVALDLLGISHAMRTNGTVLDAPAGISAPVHLQGIVRAQVKELEERCDRLADEADVNREQACLGNDPDDGPTKTYKRYRKMHFNAMMKSYEAFGRVDRKARLSLPSRVPKRQPHESYDDFQERMSYWKLRTADEHAQARARAAGERERQQEAERLAALEIPPQFHEGLPMEEFIRRLNEWKARREGKLPPKVEPLAPAVEVDASCAGAMPQSIEIDDEPRSDFSDPVSDDAAETTSEDNRNDRHDE